VPLKLLAAAADPVDMARVLIVDDDEVTRLILGRMLEDTGHEVTYAGDGSAATRIFQVGRFDVVFTDLSMPRKNGFLLIQELQEEDWRLPVIAMSGINAEQLVLAEELGAKEILYKPLEPERVQAALDEVLSSIPGDAWDLAW